MDILEHPLEAVAFRLYSLPDASVATGGAAWTCLAAVLAAAAAAAGLWRLRFSTPPAAGLKPLETEPLKEKEVPPAPTTAPCPSPKERYTAFYYRVGCCGVDDEEGEDDEEERDEDYSGAHQTPVTATDPFGWEVVRSLPLTPKASLPLNPTERYRSPTAHGSSSVVRLWDEAAASPRRRSRAVSGVLISQRPGKER